MTDTPVPAGTRGRREARERAVELAYEAELRSSSVDDLLDTLPIPPDAFTVELLLAAEATRETAEGWIAEKASGWTIERMAALDVLVMRLAIAELLRFDTPTGVVLSEAVELATRYSTDTSGRFVNGILAAVARSIER
ncbi:MAG: transcription antitermination factor NusB [Actinomycetota bacterium]